MQSRVMLSCKICLDLITVFYNYRRSLISVIIHNGAFYFRIQWNLEHCRHLYPCIRRGKTSSVKYHWYWMKNEIVLVKPHYSISIYTVPWGITLSCIFHSLYGDSWEYRWFYACLLLRKWLYSTLQPNVRHRHLGGLDPMRASILAWQNLRLVIVAFWQNKISNWDYEVLTPYGLEKYRCGRLMPYVTIIGSHNSLRRGDVCMRR